MSRSLALNVEAVRSRILENAAVPEDLLKRALETTARNLDAKKIVFFSNRGTVKDQKVVEDPEAQLRAADQVYSMAGVYTREKEVARKTPPFAIRVDPSTGVVEIVMGGDADEVNHIPITPSAHGRTLEAAPVPLSLVDTVESSAIDASIVRPRDAVSKVLFDEEVD